MPSLAIDAIRKSAGRNLECQRNLGPLRIVNETKGLYTPVLMKLRASTQHC